MTLLEIKDLVDHVGTWVLTIVVVANALGTGREAATRMMPTKKEGDRAGD